MPRWGDPFRGLSPSPRRWGDPRQEHLEMNLEEFLKKVYGMMSNKWDMNFKHLLLAIIGGVLGGAITLLYQLLWDLAQLQ